MSTLETNLEMLAACDPLGTATLRSALEPSSIQADPPDPVAVAQVEPTRSGSHTLRVTPRDTGVPRLLHSRVDPEREAIQQVANCGRRMRLYSRQIQSAEQARLLAEEGLGPKVDAVIVLGGGLLHLAKAIVAQHPGLRGLLVVEASPEIARQALSQEDLALLTQGRHFSLLTTTASRRLIAPLTDFFGRHIHDTVMCLRHDASCTVNPGFYAEVEQHLDFASGAAAMRVRTDHVHGEKFAANLLGNLETYIRSSGLTALCSGAHSLRGRPAVLIAAGPSMEHGIRELADLDLEQAVVMAAATCLQPLADAGIRPHLACSVDPLAVTGRFVDGIPAEAAPALLSAAVAAPDLVQAFAGPQRFFVRIGEPLLDQLEPALDTRPKLDAGGTVAHLMFAAARTLGCDPVILVGHDLSFPGQRTHAPGVRSPWANSVTDFSQKPRVRLIDIPCTNGRGTVPTTNTFAWFAAELEQRIQADRQNGLTTFNTSPDGALLRGAITGSITEALAGLEHSDLEGTTKQHIDAAWAISQDTSEERCRAALSILSQAARELTAWSGDLQRATGGTHDVRHVRSLLCQPTLPLLRWSLGRDQEQQMLTLRDESAQKVERREAANALASHLATAASNLSTRLQDISTTLEAAET